MITVRGLTKTYGRRDRSSPAADGVTFDVPEGQVYTLLGPSGCGKTTTLRCVAGLEHLDSGEILLDETVVASDRTFVPPNRRNIGMVFQNYAVWPHLSVFENAAFPLRATRDLRGGELKSRVMAALELVGLAAEAGRSATQLSGGQQQRLSLARAIVRRPKVLLLDEPLSNLDARLRERMRSELKLIHEQLHLTTLFVTHDQVEALSMSDRVAVMNRGRIVQEGTPEEIYNRPATDFVASFIGSTNMLKGRVLGHDAGRAQATCETDLGIVTCAVDIALVPGTSVTVAVRPEDVHLRESAIAGPGEENTFAGSIKVVLFGGATTDFQVTVNDVTVYGRTGERLTARPGDRVSISLPPGACRALPAGAGRSPAHAVAAGPAAAPTA